MHPVLQHRPEFRKHPIQLFRFTQVDLGAQHLDDLRYAEGTDQHWYDLDSPFQLTVPECKAREKLQAVAPDAGQEQAEKTGDPSLASQIGAGQGATDENAEQRQQKKFEGGELQGKSGDQGREGDDKEHAVQDVESALEQDDLEAWAVADERFHAELFVLCGNSILSSLAATLKTKIQRARMITLRMRPKPVRSNEEHRQLLEHLMEKREQEARLLHRQHRERASRLITERLTYFQLHQV